MLAVAVACVLAGAPAAARAARIRRDGYNRDGRLVTKEVVHAVTSLDASRADPADLARIARGQWGIESLHWLRDTTWAEDAKPHRHYLKRAHLRRRD